MFFLATIMISAALGAGEDSMPPAWLTPEEVFQRNYFKQMPIEKVLEESGLSAAEYLPLHPDQMKEIARILANYNCAMPQGVALRTRIAKPEAEFRGYCPIQHMIVLSTEIFFSELRISDPIKAYTITTGIIGFWDSDSAVAYSKKAANIRVEASTCKALRCKPCLDEVANGVRISGVDSVLRDPEKADVLIEAYRLQNSLCKNCKATLELGFKVTQARVRELR